MHTSFHVVAVAVGHTAAQVVVDGYAVTYHPVLFHVILVERVCHGDAVICGIGVVVERDALAGSSVAGF